MEGNFEKKQKIEDKYKIQSGFRELSPVDFWSGLVKVENLKVDKFEEILKDLADKFNFTFSGFLIKEKERDSFFYYFTRYPRKIFNIPEVEKFKQVFNELSNSLEKEKENNKTINFKTTEEKPINQPLFRIVLGLEEGYLEAEKRKIIDLLKNKEISLIEGKNFLKNVLEKKLDSLKGFLKDKIENEKDLKDLYQNIDEKVKDENDLISLLSQFNLTKIHTAEEVRERIRKNDKLKTEILEATQAQILTIGPWGKYEEPAVLIIGNKKALNEMYKFIEEMHQERFAVEDLENGKAFMVETKYCKEPDPED